jgi:hypothetical protein
VLLNYLGVDTFHQELGGVTMTQIMKPQPWQIA